MMMSGNQPSASRGFNARESAAGQGIAGSPLGMHTCPLPTPKACGVLTCGVQHIPTRTQRENDPDVNYVLPRQLPADQPAGHRNQSYATFPLRMVKTQY